MKKLLCLLLVILLFSAMAPHVLADAWFPEDGDINEALIAAPESNGSCYALNVFLSNYAEAAMQEFNYNTPTNNCISTVLKHFELNPNLYPDDVTYFYAPDGNRYMQITAGKYEKRMWDLFGRDVSAKDCPGYANGVITVSAENYGAPLTVYASTVSCNIMGENLYSVEFEVYDCKDSAFRGRYETANCNLPENRGTKIATGSALFYFNGGTAVTSFQVSDFTLTQYSLWDIAGPFPYTNSNTPYIGSPVQEESTQAETQQASTTQSETSAESNSEEQTASTNPSETNEPGSYNASQEKEVPPKNNKPSYLSTNAIIWALSITLIGVIALIAILLLFRIKQKNNNSQ